MGLISKIEQFFRSRSVLSVLIGINIAVYLLLLVAGIGLVLFKQESGFLLDALSLPAEPTRILYRPWTLITYMFTHASFWHILFNILWLYWFGGLFQSLFGHKPLGILYLQGGLAGGVLFVLAYNLFPYFEDIIPYSTLIGASASVMAIVFAVALYRPSLEIGFLFIGRIKIIYIALVLLVINIITLQGSTPEGVTTLNNAGGFFAHLGGILMGAWYASAYRKGKDLSRGWNRALDAFANLFKKRPKKRKMKVKYKRPETDREYNARKRTEQDEIDRILDKIKRAGYDALTDDEKSKLFQAGKK